MDSFNPGVSLELTVKSLLLSDCQNPQENVLGAVAAYALNSFPFEGKGLGFNGGALSWQLVGSPLS